MSLDELKELPLLPLEVALKKYTTTNPQWLENILLSQELSEFLLQFFKVQQTPGQNVDTRFVDFVGREKEDLRNCQQEKTFIPQKFDISVGRMIRYMPAHWHTNDYFELYYVFAGKCNLHFDNEVVELKEGTVILLSPTSYHASPCYSDDCILVYYMIRTSTFNSVFWNNLKEQNIMSAFFRKVLNGEEGKAYLHFETENDRKIQSLLLEIYSEYEKADDHSPQMMNALMSAFFIQLLRGYINKVQLPKDKPMHWNPQFGEVFTYIQNNYRDLTLKTLSAQFNYSERQLARIIHSATNKNFLDLLLEIRMYHAARYLTMSGQSTEKVADLVGYANASSFYRVFMKYYGISPSNYRKNVVMMS